MSDDMGEQGPKKAHLQDPRRLGIEDLHMDVGEKYFLCRTRKAPLSMIEMTEAAIVPGLACRTYG